MKKLTSLPATLLALVLCALTAVSCVDEQSELGVGLAGDGTIYNGKTATLRADMAKSVRDDSLMTSNYSYGIIGNYQDATFGKVSAELYVQIAVSDNAGSIDLSNRIIDSVVLTLVPQDLYPDSTGVYNFNFEVMHLAEALRSDTVYGSYNTLPVDPAGVFYNGTVSVGPNDSVVSLRLDDAIIPVVKQTATAAEFTENARGLRIRIIDPGYSGMMGINLAAVNSAITVYYRNHEEDETDVKYNFLLGTTAAHFQHFSHDYTGSVTGGLDSIDGTMLTYLEPLAGYNMLVSFDNDVRAFAAAHPLATIHHAELLVPVATATGQLPDRLLAYKKSAGGDTPVSDLIDLYTMAGFDGRYDAARNCYRMRVTQHLQQLLRYKHDPGTLLVLNSRRSAAARVIAAGINATDPIRIEIVYSE
ncbi:MAG: DUF4270 family protein [Bacteroidales bacterium]|nr:DUF4270 family protein [Bacteroidales bacterium]